MPALSSRAATCISSVDFPIPGSPPTRVTEPGTMPPPRTKSNSSRPVFQRSTPPVGRLESWTGAVLVTIRPSDRPTFRPTTSSTRVFQAPHASHLPAHFGCSAPQSVQRNTERALDTRGLRRIARRVVVEAGEFLFEMQFHGPGRAVALFADDHLGDPLDALVGLGVHRPVVELLAVDE